MNRRMIAYMIGQVVIIVGALMMIPMVVSLLYRESCWREFLISIVSAVAGGALLMMIANPKNKEIYAKEGFIIVAFSWVILSAVGAMPFVLSKQIPSFIDAFFEVVSGFTTTGSTILTDIEAMSKGLLFWRSFTHWIGGMGVIVFMMAIVPAQNDRNMHVMRAEVPGPTVGKLVPRLRDTARILYVLYLALSVTEVLLLLAGGMSLYDALVHMFGTAGTGGFSSNNSSIAGYNSYIQIVITAFMLVFGVNFNLYYLIVRKQPKEALKSEELRVFLLLWLGATLAIVFSLLPQHSFRESFRLAGFQTASIMSTTGYATADFNTWPQIARIILLMLMFVGGCAGSTGGGFKIARVIMLWKMIRREIRHLLHPRSVGVVRFEGKTVDDKTASGTTAYLALYILILLVGCLLVALDHVDTETVLTSVISCFNNVGPGLGNLIGPVGNFAGFSGFSKIVLSTLMLLGRLEIYPILIALTPSTWSNGR